MNNRDLDIKNPAFVLGFTSIIGQVLLLRELITIFYGNETAYAVILASWLFWVAAGSYAASFLVRYIKNPAALIGALQCAVFFLLPATIIAARNIKPLMDIQTGEIIGIIPMCIFSFLLLAPLTLLLGGLFTFICHFSDQQDGAGETTLRVGSIYLWESIGATVGGLIFSFFLVHIMPAMHMAFLVAALNIAAGIFLNKERGGLFITRTVLILITVGALLSGMIGRLDQWTRARQWKGLEVVAITDSIYGNIAMTKLGWEYSLYENGLHSFSTRDDMTSEESVHFPLLEHPDPRSVLLIGNGMGGSLRQVLKHPQAQVDYVELDPKVIEVSRQYLPAEYLEPLNDDRVEVIYADARWLVKRSSKKYDVVIVNLSDPYTALINRYYSLEFFQEVHAILNPGGILALSVSSSENYLNEETREFLRAINTTLKKVFPDVKSIPGDTNIFLACTAKGVLTYDHQLLIDRLNERRIEAQYVREYYLPFKLSDDRILYIEEALKKEGALNTDMHPIAYLYDIVLWSTHFNTTFKNLVAKIQGIKFYHLLAVPLLIFLGGWGMRKVAPTSPVTLSIMTTGFSEIIFQVVVILAFQTLYGYAYYKIGLIMASFMGGLCLGTVMARRVIARCPGNIPKIYKITQLAIVLYPLLLPLVFVVFRDASTTQRLAGVLATVFATLPVIAGTIGGLQYPLATHIIHQSNANKGEGAAGTAGFLYAVDVFGATIGALVTGMFLIPLLGIYAVALLCAVINGVVFILLYPSKLSSVV